MAANDRKAHFVMWLHFMRLLVGWLKHVDDQVKA